MLFFQFEILLKQKYVKASNIQFGNKILVFLQKNKNQLFREGEKCDENLA